MIEIIDSRIVETQERDNMNMMTLAERLKLIREERGWTKEELRRRAGLRSSSTLTTLEKGASTESPQLGVIAAALGVEVMWLQFGRGPKYKGDDPIVEMGSTALKVAKVVDSMPKPLQDKALLHVVTMKEMHDIEKKLASEEKPRKPPAQRDAPPDRR